MAAQQEHPNGTVKNWLVKKLRGVAVAEGYEGGANTGSDDLNVREKIPWLM